MSELLEAEIAAVAGQLLLAAEEQVAAQLWVTGAIGSYRVDPPAEVRPSARRNVGRVVAALRGEELSVAGVAEEERGVGHCRAFPAPTSWPPTVAASRCCVTISCGSPKTRASPPTPCWSGSSGSGSSATATATTSSPVTRSGARPHPPRGAAADGQSARPPPAVLCI